MPKVLIAPDKFKGSLSAMEVCLAIKKGIFNYDPLIECLVHPLADGGEGTLDVLADCLNLRTIKVEVNDPLFRPVDAHYQMSGDKSFIEMSLASGLQLLNAEERNCMRTTSYGTGELILHAIRNNARKIYLFIGGSATNDAGIGLASALGYRFLDISGNEISPIGATLKDLKQIDDTHLKFEREQIEINVVCDVKNPLFGPFGAAHIYGPQKGASPGDIKILDQGLFNFSAVVKLKYGIDLSDLEGGGAAGGIGAGAVGLLNAQLQPGIQSVMEITCFTDRLESIDLVITGEGKLDNQTIQGKVVNGVYQSADIQGIPVSIICGVAEDLDIIESKIKSPIYQLISDEISIEEAIKNANKLVEQRAFQLIKDFFFEKSF